MAELYIEERQIGEVTVLDLAGEIRIGDSSVALRAFVRRLVDEGKRKLVLNLAGVRYVDSSGIGELVNSYTYVGKRNGIIRLAKLTEKVQDLLTIQKLLIVYDVYDSVEEAVRSFEEEDKYIICPVYGCHHSIRFSPEFYPITVCRNCGTEISVILSAENNQVSVRTLILPTYDNEQIKIEVGMPITIQIVGRLDLFASEVLERAWLTVPSPRRVIFELEAHHEITSAGMQKVLALCDSKEAGARAVILTTAERVKSLVSANAPVYREKQKATEALGVVNDGGWTLSLVPVQGETA